MLPHMRNACERSAACAGPAQLAVSPVYQEAESVVRERMDVISRAVLAGLEEGGSARRWGWSLAPSLTVGRGEPANSGDCTFMIFATSEAFWCALAAQTTSMSVLSV